MHTDLKSNRHKARTLSGEPVNTWNVDATNAGSKGLRKHTAEDYALAKHELSEPLAAAEQAIAKRDVDEQVRIKMDKRVSTLKAAGYSTSEIKEIFATGTCKRIESDKQRTADAVTETRTGFSIKPC
ncbi:hypothetical protein ACOMICROBIO_NCLOACGD_02049 [Vibrio sp. B1ASS3]|uniref:hypothetical protein n=1 Tax=Vibrio TaxID=662 RepID=UPI001ABAB871|nr:MULTISPECIES: hypothetical protein [Vibrio]MCD1414085.1 hypothetical protein [Vibrio parahaemolyticus]CAD7809465.1 hypothetical protein ACOMICROBIO_NCLOACGD_02049 [Vibrio sp. B1ASS3]CAE6909590.1 hypothetical protein ACOMICROBIO_NCLOACGD_02049 [Vibrio sp. B1ASS3]